MQLLFFLDLIAVKFSQQNKKSSPLYFLTTLYVRYKIIVYYLLKGYFDYGFNKAQKFRLCNAERKIFG